jgi:hypothetical protein
MTVNDDLIDVDISLYERYDTKFRKGAVLSDIFLKEKHNIINSDNINYL